MKTTNNWGVLVRDTQDHNEVIPITIEFDLNMMIIKQAKDNHTIFQLTDETDIIYNVGYKNRVYVEVEINFVLDGEKSKIITLYTKNFEDGLKENFSVSWELYDQLKQTDFSKIRIMKWLSLFLSVTFMIYILILISDQAIQSFIGVFMVIFANFPAIIMYFYINLELNKRAKNVENYILNFNNL